MSQTARKQKSGKIHSQGGPPVTVLQLSSVDPNLRILHPETTIVRTTSGGPGEDPVESLRPIIDLVLDHGAKAIVKSETAPTGAEVEILKNVLQNPDSLRVAPERAILGVPTNQTLSALFSCHYNNIDQKDTTLSALDDVVRHLAGGSRIAQHVGLIADELFTNGIVHTPLNDTTDGMAPNRIEVFQHKHTVLLVYRDQFGHLDVQSVFRRFRECSEKGMGIAMNRGVSTTGAGIGLFLAFEHADQFFVHVAKGQSTTIGVGFRLNARPGLAGGSASKMVFVHDTIANRERKSNGPASD